MENFKYQAGDKVKCVALTESNVEGLTLGKIYTVIGAEMIAGAEVYALKDDKKILYSTDMLLEVEKESNMEGLKGTFRDDMVNHPPHYTSGGIEVIDYMEAKMTPEQFKGYLIGQVLKYMSRAGKKQDELEDYKKAQWYLTKLIGFAISSEASVESDSAEIRPISKKQIGYIAGLTEKAGLDRHNLPDNISPLPNYKDLTEGEASELIRDLIAINRYLDFTLTEIERAGEDPMIKEINGLLHK
jgi:hypothetical protein